MCRLQSSDAMEHRSKVRILVADNHEAILAKVEGLLGDDFDIIDSVSNGQDAVNEVIRSRPDILIIDISIPILNGLEAASQLRSRNSGTKIVILTVHEDPEIISAALESGATGYVFKERVTTDLVPAIQACLQGGRFISRPAQP
jgi:DNA-binding NarL/FixJ family response regulator